MNKLRNFKKLGLVLALMGALTAIARAAAPDPSTVTATATTAFEAVATLSVAMLAFFVVFRIVKAIRK